MHKIFSNLAILFIERGLPNIIDYDSLLKIMLPNNKTKHKIDLGL